MELGVSRYIFSFFRTSLLSSVITLLGCIYIYFRNSRRAKKEIEEAAVSKVESQRSKRKPRQPHLARPPPAYSPLPSEADEFSLELAKVNGSGIKRDDPSARTSAEVPGHVGTGRMDSSGG